MPATQISKKYAALTADATAAGLVTIASNDGWLPGAIVNISSATEASAECIIVQQVGSTQLVLRFTNSDVTARGGFSDLAIYDLADTAAISMIAQVVPVQQVFTARTVA